MAAIAPSGEQFEIAFGDQRAVVVEVGGGLRAYSAGGRELLDGYGVDEICPSGRGQVLIPWPNRLQDGSYEFDGRRHQLAARRAGAPNAIHGLVRWSGWTVAEREPHRVVMEHVLHAQPGYPFSLALSIEYRLSAEGLRVRTTATNVGTKPCPYGTGAHPYLTAGTRRVDSVMLRAPARTVLRSDERGIPIGGRPRRRHGVRLPAAAADRRDQARPLLHRPRARRGRPARVELRDADGERAVLWVDEAYPYLMLFTGDPLPDVDRRSLAVEPMTCPPNAFRTGRDLIRLEPGESATSTWGIAPPD